VTQEDRAARAEDRQERMEVDITNIRVNVATIKESLVNHLAHHESRSRHTALMIAPITAIVMLGLQLLAKALGWL